MSIAKKISIAGVLGAMATILYIFPTFPILPMFPWLKIDFADAPALLASAVISPVAGGAIIFVRNLIHALLFTKTAMIGELSNFLVSFLFVTSAGMIARVLSRRALPKTWHLLVALPVSALMQVVTAALSNKYIMVPLYSSFVNFEEIGVNYYIYAGVVPFNLIKVVVVSFIFAILYRVVVPRIKQYM